MKRLVAAFATLLASLAVSAATLEPLPGTSLQFTAPGATVPEPIGVVVRDEGGAPVESAQVTFTIVAVPPETANGFFPGSGTTVTVASDEFGIAIPEPGLVAIAEGSVTVVATTPGATESVTFLVIVEGGGLEAASVSLISARHLVTPVSATQLQPLIVQVLDANGEPVPFAAVQFSAPLSGPSGTFDGASSTLVVADAEGIAQAPLFVTKSIAGQGKIEITVPGTQASTAVRFINTPAPSQHRCRPAASSCRV